ncbi:UDP-N-acetylglucosamine diphosphorylase/glucosamine-1-phosphate N-acetyltransferase [Marinomonas agarivorans]|nr:UDP-N-acetylglucosamine diphosphorylase/glucosamine-1-phosphate N-acetyltransferase [Marinomonas agarivorans]
MSHKDIVVLAAGKGSRMKSNKSKVLHEIAGVPMIRRVLETANNLSNSRLHLVVGHQGASVADHCQDFLANVVWQDNPKGTGDAVKRVADHLSGDGMTLTLYGDVPLIRQNTLEQMTQAGDDNTLVLLTVLLEDATGYGRIVRDENNDVMAIVEQKDATPAQAQIREANTGILLAPNKHLLSWLSQLDCNNAQGEYYLTDIIAMAARDGLKIVTVHPSSESEVAGVNDRVQLAQLEREWQKQQADNLMRQGLTLADPSRFDLRGSLKIGIDSFIDINCVIEGDVSIGDNVVIGPNCHLKNCSIGDGSHIKNNSSIEESLIAEACEIGPYARLRPGTKLAEKAKIGNFVETKKADIGAGSKVNHLSYVGDTEMGANVNVGAGTITCNYDGVNKFKTEIGDDVFVGSNSSLVAPAKIGSGATIAAGSTITKPVNNDQLAFARARQTNKDGWSKPTKK